MTRHNFLALALLALTGCGSHQEAERQTAVIPPTRNAQIPLDAPYQITSDGDEGPVRRLVEVKLKRKVSPEVLREIALEVKAKEERPHERTVIFYYLPVEFPELAGQPWASTHFKPALDVKILGLTKQEEDTMRSIRLDHKGKRIGAWLPDNQYKTLDLIYDEDGAIKIAEISSPTARSDSDMIEMPGFDLRLMSSMNEISGMPPEGRNLIVVATVSKELHIRIFDSNGKTVVETDEKGLTDKAQQIKDLKGQLESLWPPHELTANEKARLIFDVASIVGHTQMPSTSGRRFKKEQGSNIYDVDLNGNLRISNAEGKVFSAARPLKRGNRDRE
jgi:hypothetical protein